MDWYCVICVSKTFINSAVTKFCWVLALRISFTFAYIEPFLQDSTMKSRGLLQAFWDKVLIIHDLSDLSVVSPWSFNWFCYFGSFNAAFSGGDYGDCVTQWCISRGKKLFWNHKLVFTSILTDISCNYIILKQCLEFCIFVVPLY